MKSGHQPEKHSHHDRPHHSHSQPHASHDPPSTVHRNDDRPHGHHESRNSLQGEHDRRNSQISHHGSRNSLQGVLTHNESRNSLPGRLSVPVGLDHRASQLARPESRNSLHSGHDRRTSLQDWYDRRSSQHDRLGLHSPHGSHALFTVPPSDESLYDPQKHNLRRESSPHHLPPIIVEDPEAAAKKAKKEKMNRLCLLGMPFFGGAILVVFGALNVVEKFGVDECGIPLLVLGCVSIVTSVIMFIVIYFDVRVHKRRRRSTRVVPAPIIRRSVSPSLLSRESAGHALPESRVTFY